MHLVQVVHIQLKDSAKDRLAYRAYTRVQEWLTQWTAVANFKAVLADTPEAALEICRKELQNKLVPTWLSKETVTPDMFEFEVATQEVKDGRFWLSSQAVWGHWHQIPPLAVTDKAAG